MEYLKYEKVVGETPLKKPSNLGWSETLINENIPRRSSSFQDILPPFPIVKNPDNFIITFDVNITTQVLTQFKKSKRFEEIYNLIGMYFYKSRKIKRRLKHSELKLTNIRFWIYNQF